MTAKTKIKPLNTILKLLPELERPDIALVEAKLGELLNGNGISRRVKKVMEFSFAFKDKEYNLKNSANGVAREVAQIIYPQLRNVKCNPVRVFTGRQTANFWKRSEFSKIVKAIQDAGGEIVKFPGGIK
ncbi:MAG: hypothetical protein WBB67_14325 [bacterium]